MVSFSSKTVQKWRFLAKTSQNPHHMRSKNIFFENSRCDIKNRASRGFYNMLWHYVPERGGPKSTIWRTSSFLKNVRFSPLSRALQLRMAKISFSSQNFDFYKTSQKCLISFTMLRKHVPGVPKHFAIPSTII